MSLQSPPKRSATNRFEDKPPNLTEVTYRSAHFVTNTKIETALLIHGIIYSRKFWEFGPVMFKGVIKETVVGTAGTKHSVHLISHCWNQAFKGKKKSLGSNTLGFCQLTQQVPRNMVLRFLVLFNLSFTFTNSRKANQAQLWDLGNLWQLNSCH